MINNIIENIHFFVFLLCTFIISGLAKEYNIFGGLLDLVAKIKDKRFSLFLISCLSGILPIPNRIVFACSLFDSLISKDLTKKDKKHLGIISFLSTHHYYWWSPLEKTVAVPMVVFSLSYVHFLSYVWIPILVSLMFLFYYIYVYVDKNTKFFMINKAEKNDIFPAIALLSGLVGMFFFDNGLVFSVITLALLCYYKEFNIKKILSYIKWKLAFIVLGILVFNVIIASYSHQLMDYFKIITKNLNTNSLTIFIIISSIGMLISFILGSSSKYVLISTTLASIFGLAYLPFFLIIEHIGYLLSPTHKCVLTASAYFGTPLLYYYKILLIFSVILLFFGIVSLI